MAGIWLKYLNKSEPKGFRTKLKLATNVKQLLTGACSLILKKDQLQWNYSTLWFQNRVIGLFPNQ
jgi:hypothetical protein